jgi:hypothetical protein
VLVAVVLAALIVVPGFALLYVLHRRGLIPPSDPGAKQASTAAGGLAVLLWLMMAKPF